MTNITHDTSQIIAHTKDLTFLKIQIISLKNTHQNNLKILVISQLYFITDNFISIFMVILYKFKINLYYLYKKNIFFYI